MKHKKIKITGSAFGLGSKVYTTNEGPDFVRNFTKDNPKISKNIIWGDLVGPEYDLESHDENGRNFSSVCNHNKHLCSAVSDVVKDQNVFPVVLGGDHCCAIGTWSGVTNVLNAEGQFGLIWIDAHMDAHTYETSPSKAYHGMPVAVLLGEGKDELVSIGKSGRKIRPEHLVLIGIRCFEEGEHDRLERLGVRIYYIEEVKSRGIDVVFQEALEIVRKNTLGFGVSLDIDAFDPEQAPGVGTPAPNGLDVESTVSALPVLFSADELRAVEITEFNPTLDKDDKTAKIVERILGRIVDSLAA